MTPGNSGISKSPNIDWDTTKPETIQPIVPHSRILGKSFSTDSTFWKVIALTSANVGM